MAIGESYAEACYEESSSVDNRDEMSTVTGTLKKSLTGTGPQFVRPHATITECRVGPDYDEITFLDGLGRPHRLPLLAGASHAEMRYEVDRAKRLIEKTMDYQLQFAQAHLVEMGHAVRDVVSRREDAFSLEPQCVGSLAAQVRAIRGEEKKVRWWRRFMELENKGFLVAYWDSLMVPKKLVPLLAAIAALIVAAYAAYHFTLIGAEILEALLP